MAEMNKSFLGYEVMYDRLSITNQELRSKLKASEDELAKCQGSLGQMDLLIAEANENARRQRDLEDRLQDFDRTRVEMKKELDLAEASYRNLGSDLERTRAELAKEKAGNRPLYRAYRSAKDDGIRSGRKAAGEKYKGALVAYRQFVMAGRKRTTIMWNLDQAKAASSIFQEVVNKEIADAPAEL